MALRESHFVPTGLMRADGRYQAASGRQSSLRVLLFTVILMGSVSATLAQERASIFGTISDPSGAAVPSATVQVTAATTGVIRTTTTNSAGYYIIGDLIPDNYSV